MGTHGNCVHREADGTVVFAQHAWERFRALEPHPAATGSSRLAFVHRGRGPVLAGAASPLGEGLPNRPRATIAEWPVAGDGPGRGARAVIQRVPVAVGVEVGA